MKRFLVIVSTLVLFAGTTNLWAWSAMSGFGHHCAAYIAEQHLTPEAKAKCEEYLQHSFVFYAGWMDQWRHIKPFEETSVWHAVWVDKNWKLDRSKQRFAEYQSERIWKEMKDYKNLPDSLVRQNLIFLIHMVPDFHCPVHVHGSKADFPEHYYALRKNGRKFGLHTFWDRAPGFHREGWTIERYAKEVDVISPKVAKKWQKGNVIKWAKDSAKQAKRAYEITPANIEITKMSDEEIKSVHALADEMILKGGYRLAQIINDIFKK